MPTDVSDEAAVNALAAAAVERFGTAHVVCNNAGVVSPADAWFGPVSAWNWVMGVNLWGVIYGVARLPADPRRAGRRPHPEHVEHGRPHAGPEPEL